MRDTIILLSGKQGAGKTTVTRMLRQQIEAELGYSFLPLKLADALYEMHDAVLEVLGRYGIKREIKKDGPLLQLLGTEWGRKTIDQDIWARLAQARVRQVLGDQDGPPRGRRPIVVCIDDCRFENEFDAFPEALRVRLECDRELRKARCEMWREIEMHPSEIGLDGYSQESRFDMKLRTDFWSAQEVADKVFAELRGRFRLRRYTP